MSDTWVILSLHCVTDMPKPPEEDIYIFPDEYKLMSRGKRAIMLKPQSYQRLNVETLVVVDRKMMENHGQENITTYVLTVLNMVNHTLLFYSSVCLSIYLLVCLSTSPFVHPFYVPSILCSTIGHALKRQTIMSSRGQHVFSLGCGISGWRPNWLMIDKTLTLLRVIIEKNLRTNENTSEH